MLELSFNPFKTLQSVKKTYDKSTNQFNFKTFIIPTLYTSTPYEYILKSSKFSFRHVILLYNHQVQAHAGAPADFAINVTSSHKDALSRQTTEAVNIALAQDDIGEENVMNSKSEFHQPSITRLQTRITHGL